MDPRSSALDALSPRGRGGDIVLSSIEQYLERLEATRDAVLIEMERQATERDFPIVGPVVGRLLSVLAQSIWATRILELGSGYGYSAYWFARALPADGELILTEKDPANSSQAEAFFRQGGVRCRLHFLVGDAFKILDGLPGESDNMLWGGRVTHPAEHPTTQGAQDLIRLLFQAPNLVTSLLPVRDGVSVSLKLD